MPISKVFPDIQSALAELSDGAVVMIGGQGGVGSPQALLQELARKLATDLTLIAQATSAHQALAELVRSGRVRKLITPSPVEERRRPGALQVEVTDAGLLAERIRAGGAGIGAFLTGPVDSNSDPGGKTQALDGQPYALHYPLKADFALIRAHQADTLGNLVYRGAARGWNPLMATAARMVVAQVDEIVEPGQLDPELVVTPGIYVDRIVVHKDPADQGVENLPSHDLVLGPLWQLISGSYVNSLTDQKSSKMYPDASLAVADLFDGAMVMFDGFGSAGGLAQYLMLALRDQGAKGLTMVSNTAGIASVVNFGTPRGHTTIDHSILVENRQIKKSIASFPVSPSPSRPSAFELAYKAGKVELELAPQGTLAERIRAGGLGIAAFYTPTGAGTLVAEGKPTHVIDGREHVLERALRADFALLRAYKADQDGNVVYRGTSRNFNAAMAPAANVTIVEVDEVVERGALDPESIVTPGVFVDRIVQRPPGFSSFQPIA